MPAIPTLTNKEIRFEGTFLFVYFEGRKEREHDWFNFQGYSHTVFREVFLFDLVGVSSAPISQSSDLGYGNCLAHHHHHHHHHICLIYYH